MQTHKLEEVENARKAYNERITQLDERYTSLTPLNSYIIRLFIRDEKKTKSGLYLPDVKIKQQSHSGMAEWEATDPWQFTQKAVIVAIPSFEQELKPGDIVQIAGFSMHGDKESITSYDIQYTHPDYMTPRFPPTNPEDEDFGYGIVPRTHIKVLISKVGTKPKSNEVE